MFADLDPRAVLQITTPQTPTPLARAKYRARVRKEVLSCANCQLHAHQPAGRCPVPFVGPSKPAFVVVGEAPGPEESKLGRPFVGPSGKLLRSLMHSAGIDPDDEVLWCNTVSCMPGPGDGTFRAPTPGETAFCRDNLLSQVDAGYTPYVLLVGAKALHAFRSDLQVTRDHGRVFIWLDTFCVMPIIHPAAALRGKREFKKLIKLDLERWAEVVYGGDNPVSFLGEHCVKCGQPFVSWDRDGVPWCQDHLKAWGKNWEKERRAWNVKTEALMLDF